MRLELILPQVNATEYQKSSRVYPQGVTRPQTLQRVKGLGVMLYLLGLSYGVVALALEVLGVYISKSSVYKAVQAAAEQVPGLRRKEVSGGLQTPAMGGDLTSVKCNGGWLPLGLAVDDTTGLVLTVDRLSAEDAETVKKWQEPVAEAVHCEPKAPILGRYQTLNSHCPGLSRCNALETRCTWEGYKHSGSVRLYVW